MSPFVAQHLSRSKAGGGREGERRMPPAKADSQLDGLPSPASHIRRFTFSTQSAIQLSGHGHLQSFLVCKTPALTVAVGSPGAFAAIVSKTQCLREHRGISTHNPSVPSVSPCFKSGLSWFGRERLSGLARLRRRWSDQQRCLPSGNKPPYKNTTLSLRSRIAGAACWYRF